MLKVRHKFMQDKPVEQLLKIIKPGIFMPSFIIVWVSKYLEIKFPYTILKRISAIQKKIFKYFIHILEYAVENTNRIKLP